MEQALERLEQAVWSWPLLLLILGTGLWLHLRLKGFPLRKLPRAVRCALTGGAGKTGVSPFASLCTSLSATLGTGNMVGVASALALGGPGALFWMNLGAIVGMSVKYAEGVLAVKYRVRAGDGYTGGPFQYLSRGLGKGGRLLAAVFAFFGAFAGLFGVGTFVQVNSITQGAELWAATMGQVPELTVFGRRITGISLGLGVLLAVLTALVIFGGIRRISRVSSLLVPAMAGVYLLCCGTVLVLLRERLPEAISQVFREAFTGRAATGGLLGAIQAGISRGVFSNEAGLGTAPIAAAAAETDSPVDQGLVCMLGNVLDTNLVCTVTGLVILCTGVWTRGMPGVMTAAAAFSVGLPVPKPVSVGLLILCLSLFAFTTVLGWNYYAVSCLSYLTQGSSRAKRIYQILYVGSVLIAPLCTASGVWTAANLCNGLMAVPNLIGLLLLTPQICKETRSFLDKGDKIKIKRGTYEADLFRRPAGRLRQAAQGPVHRRARRTAGPSPGGLSNA